MHFDVIEAKAIEHLKLAVRFADGTTGTVVFNSSHLFGVFEAMGDPNFFQQVRCRDGFVSWPGDLDLAPDAMYAAIKKDGQWVLS